MIHFKNARLIDENGISPRQSLFIRDGKIIKNPALSLQSKFKTVDLKGSYLAPGFIDLHIHGALGADTMDATHSSWNKISEYHAKGGTTAFALTTVTCTTHDLERVLKLATSKPHLKGSLLLGIHVEGPFLSPELPGAHEVKKLRCPDKSYLALLKKYSASIKQLTIAPELKDAFSFIQQLKSFIPILSTGHTNATDQETLKAFKSGINHATHLHNCMSRSYKKGALRYAGALETILGHAEISAEVIADGFHVTKELLRLTYQAKGVEKLHLITDATAGAGIKPGTKFTVGNGIEAKVHENHALTLDGLHLAGSTIQMIDSVKTMADDLKVPLHLAVKMATLNPARKLKLEKRMGTLKIGSDANLVVLIPNLSVTQTWVAGVQVA
jgi:N-acetylglucosamine-6-phosphate deacetylase